MQIEVISDKNLARRIEYECSNSPVRDRVEMIFDAFSGYNIYEMGGSIRNAVLSEWYKIPFCMRDQDFLIDDSNKDVDLFKVCRRYGFQGELKPNFYGTVKWTVDGFDIDISRLSSGTKTPTLESWLKACDFNINGIVFSHDTGKIHSYGALEGMRTKNIVLIKPESERPEATLVRSVDFERRFSDIGFTLDYTVIDFIRENYSESMDLPISRYMSYKRMSPALYSKILDRLRDISK